MGLRKHMRMLGVAGLMIMANGPVLANSALDASAKLRSEGMTLWRNGDFLGAFGTCFGAREVLKGVKGINRERLSEALGFAELCIGLALQQMKVRAGRHDYCRAFTASQKHFALVDAARKARGEKLVDGGYLTEQLKDTRCAK